jgi:Asp-tRNA(Asn)/Glu-tRNA(Gln) amidotransferase A subunit family amidase
MLTRRQWYRTLAGLGIGSATFQRALAAQVTQPPKQGEPNPTITAEMIQQAEWISGVTLTDAERKRLATPLSQMLRQFRDLRKIKLDNSVPPAVCFQPIGARDIIIANEKSSVKVAPRSPVSKPASDEDLAFASVATLYHLLRSKQVSSRELTKMSLDRLKKYDPAMLCVVSLLEESALKQADAADKELAAGQDRGPLHGIPWGAKDLIAVPGTKTTWGAEPFKNQVIDVKATVVEKLEAAGAVLVAKLTLGALAMGDRWFGGMTRSPWNVKQGSSGSSAGSAAASAAGLVPFALGSETLGSIVSPCRVCGTTGLRPTFGRVSRHGCMALVWSMDKIGPLARSIEDCALAFGIIQGPDPRDPTTVDRPFHWPARRDLKSLKVGVFENTADADKKVLKDLGVELVTIKLPSNIPSRALLTILNAEAGASFDELTRQGVREGIGSWPATFQQAQFIPAVEYLRANRIRTLLMQEMEKLFEKVDLYLGGDDLVITNLTGHPTVVMPHGFRTRNGVETPGSITFTGRLYGESDLLAVAHAFQQQTGHHLKRPPMDQVTVERRNS